MQPMIVESKMFVIRYKSLQNIEYASKHAMEKYLDSELGSWSDFVEYLTGNFNNIRIGPSGNYSHFNKIMQSWKNLKHHLESEHDFNKNAVIEVKWGGNIHICMPPSKKSLFGIGILSLFNGGLHTEAVEAFIGFLLEEGVEFQGCSELCRNAEVILKVLKVSEFPSLKSTSPQKLSGIVSSGETILASLKDAEIAAHEDKERLFEHFDILKQEGDLFLEERKLEFGEFLQKQSATFSSNLEERSKQFLGKQKSFDSAIKRTANLAREKFDQARLEYDEFSELIREKLKLEAPASLWIKRAKLHKDAARNSLIVFVLLILMTVLASFLSISYFDNVVISQFYDYVCVSSENGSIQVLPSGSLTSESPDLSALNCSREFSVRGPLTVSILLLSLSLLLWLIRLSYRVFLSERHLRLNAEEKVAFSESFMAMKLDKNLDDQNEAIVLGALFRPTQDGIIKDDDGVLDVSALSALARQLSR